jgi:hypothetical protein
LSDTRIPRLVIIAGWLLTPIVAWAVSLLGGWIGALVAPKSGEGLVPFAALLVGLVVGAVAGLAAWIAFMRVIVRRGMRRDEPTPEHSPLAGSHQEAHLPSRRSPNGSPHV